MWRDAMLAVFLLAAAGAAVDGEPAARNAAQNPGGQDQDRIRPHEANRFLWQYQGKPLLLLGGSDTDNLFQWERDALAAHLDLLVSVGGNYVRNTMQSRNEGDLRPFARAEDGRYDLNRWNDAYWKRLDQLLALAQERGVVVQIEIWDPHDYYHNLGAQGGWSRQHFNPANNVTYTFEESGLIEVVDWSGVHNPEKDNPFFQTAPAERDLALVRGYQERFVRKVVEVSSPFPNVLYCVSNETNGSPAWSDYWASFLRREAERMGRRIYVGEMTFRPTPPEDQILNLIEREDLYDFVDVSQLNRARRQWQWDNLMLVRQRLAERPRPVNNTKIYGGDEVKWTGGDRNGEECFWRNVFAGCASARFHRPPSGLGLSPLAQAHIRSARLLTGAMEWFSAEPRNDLLSEREPDEAYCRAEPGRAYAVYFPKGGAVRLALPQNSGAWTVRWLDIRRSEWKAPVQSQPGGALSLKAPSEEHWAVLVRPEDQ